MAIYPNATGSDGTLFVLVNNLSTLLNGGINAAVTTITVTSTTGFPSVGYITIDNEAIFYTGKNATQFTGCTRGADGTTAATHINGSTVYHNFVANHHNVIKDEVAAIEADLRTCINTDLTDSQAVSTTAATMRMRLDQISTRLAALGNSADWKTGFPGKITAATQASIAAGTQTAATSYTSTGLAITTDMSTNTSRAIITLQLPRFKSSLGLNLPAYLTIFRGSTDIANNANGLIAVQHASGEDLPAHLRLIDSPSTNGSVTYTVNFRAGTTSSDAIIGSGSMPSFLIVETLRA